jgi:hypothetical protein
VPISKVPVPFARCSSRISSATLVFEGYGAIIGPCPHRAASDRHAGAIQSKRHDYRCQCQCESVMPIELHQPAITVSDNLRTHLAVAVTAQPKLLRAMFDVGYFLPNTPPDTAGH